MIYVQFLLGGIVYCLSAWMSYSNFAKTSSWYFLTGLLLSNITNFLWLVIAKQEPDIQALFVKTRLWDVMIIACYFIIPLIMFKLNLTPKQWLGSVMFFTSIFLLKA